MQQSALVAGGNEVHMQIAARTHAERIEKRLLASGYQRCFSAWATVSAPIVVPKSRPGGTRRELHARANKYTRWRRLRRKTAPRLSERRTERSSRDLLEGWLNVLLSGKRHWQPQL
jgi:hypothetical protein